MNRGREAVEYFLWTGDKSREKLAYYDQNGNYFEKPVPKGAVDEVLKLFDGRPRSVERSSGGFVSVEPHQIVVIETPNAKGEPELSIRIRVRFKDLKRNERHEVISNEVVNHTKVVLPHELKETFVPENIDPQNFVLDFGRGIIPVHVFDYVRTQTGEIFARFVRNDDLEKILTSTKGSKHELKVYQVHRDVLRAIPPTGSQPGGKDFATAKAHAERLKERGESLIPECLATGELVSIPTGSGLSVSRQYLRMATPSTKTLVRAEPVYINVEPLDEDDLIPFGTFER